MNLSRLQKNFESLAAQDPYWTVLSDNSKRGGKWDPEELYQSGEDIVRYLEEQLSRLGIAMRGAKALDFGCGVGRLTFPLSRRFDQAIGIDISASMIQRANENAGRGNDCSFLVNTKADLSCFDTESFDFVYSDIVFQHIAPRLTKRYFREIARILKPDSHFVFQLPSHLNPEAAENRLPLRLARKRLSYLAKSLSQSLGIGAAYFEMNAIPSHRLIPFMQRKAQLELVSLWHYPAAGPQWQSYLYVFKKPNPPPPSQAK